MKNCYGYTELLKDLLELKEVYCQKVSVTFAGNSVRGRGIPLIKIGSGDKKLLAVASVHGREFVSSCFVMRCLKDFLDRSYELEGKALYVLPMLNPDGVEIAQGKEKPLNIPHDFKPELFKNNSNNINLNANFPFCFHRVPKERQGGIKAASEPEAKALIRLCEKERFMSAISLHARGNCVFWRDLGNGRVKGDYELAKRLEESCGFELIEPTQKAQDYSGGFENWFRFRYRKPALCVELVEDEEISFSDMCFNFEEAVNWSKTGDLLKIFADFC